MVITSIQSRHCGTSLVYICGKHLEMATDSLPFGPGELREMRCRPQAKAPEGLWMIASAFHISKTLCFHLQGSYVDLLLSF